MSKKVRRQESLWQSYTKIGTGAILWLLCLQLLVVQAIVRRTWPVPYNARINYISDLGAVNCQYHVARLTLFADAICSPRHAWMNISFVLQGILMCAGCMLLRSLFARTRLSNLALAMIFFTGLMMMALGLAPEDTHEHRHIIAAIAHSFFQNVGLILLGISLLRRRHVYPLWGWMTAFAGAVGLLFAVLMFFRSYLAPGYLGLGPGGIQQLSLYPSLIWFTGSSLFILLRCKTLCDESRIHALRPELNRSETKSSMHASAFLTPQAEDLSTLTFRKIGRS
jgi:hypothetical membrane protein